MTYFEKGQAMRRMILILVAIPFCFGYAQNPQVELFQTVEDFYWDDIGLEMDYDSYGGQHLIQYVNYDLRYNYVDIEGDSIGWIEVSWRVILIQLLRVSL